MARGSNQDENFRVPYRNSPPLSSEQSLDLMRIISGKTRSALRLAAKAHEKQTRSRPDAEDDIYLLHPLAVANLLAGAGADRNLICAGCLHDTVEDTDVTLDYIQQEFGQEVASLVEAVTKDQSFKNIPLEQQAQAVISKCSRAGQDGLALKGADLLVNLTDLVLDAEQYGPQHWQQVFGKKRAPRKIAHYLELADLIASELNEYPQLNLALQKRASELRQLAKEFGWLEISAPSRRNHEKQQ